MPVIPSRHARLLEAIVEARAELAAQLVEPRKASRVSSRIATRPAAIVTGLALNVPPCGAAGVRRRGIEHRHDLRAAPTAPTGKPPPMILPSVVMSGVTPNAPWAPW